MSGTSMDGVDIAAATFPSGRIEPIASDTFNYDETTASLLKQAIYHAESINAVTLAELDNTLGQTYANMLDTFIKQHNIDKQGIVAIGSHGHTLLHQPTTKNRKGFSLQIGNANHIAALTGCKVVADFRRADIALGGQGAPLAPAFHAAFLGKPNTHRIIANIGGIANITLLNGSTVSGGFDTGPGNTLIDGYTQLAFGQAYDKNGAIAATGKLHHAICDLFLSDKYFSFAPPKSTGREYFNLQWINKTLGNETSAITNADMLHNLCYLTAKSLSDACLQYQDNTEQLIVCGGGAHNKTLMQMLTDLLPFKVTSTADFALDPDYIEALAFAWLAKQRIENCPANLPQVTGASRASQLGVIYEI